MKGDLIFKKDLNPLSLYCKAQHFSLSGADCIPNLDVSLSSWLNI